MRIVVSVIRIFSLVNNNNNDNDNNYNNDDDDDNDDDDEQRPIGISYRPLLKWLILKTPNVHCHLRNMAP